jgi:hypothetical protein
MTREQDQEHRAEAERLALLPRAEQRQWIQVQREIATDPALTPDQRAEAAERVTALEKYLRQISRRKPPKPS